MTERTWRLWDRRRRLRERMSITLYGSYHPSSEMDLLERQRDMLRGAGYDLACLVKDGPDDVVDPLEASKRYLENSDVSFLIFTRAGMRHGLVRELAHVASAAMRHKVADCVVFDQVDGSGGSSVPTCRCATCTTPRSPATSFLASRISAPGC